MLPIDNLVMATGCAGVTGQPDGLPMVRTLIRKMEVPDLDACLLVWWQACLVGHGFLPMSVKLRQWRRLRDGQLNVANTWLALHDRQVAGFASLSDPAQLAGLFVAPAHQRKGIGRQLVAHIAAMAGALEVDVYQANQEARAFYREQGFQTVDRRFPDLDGEPYALLRMRQKLELDLGVH